ncbi:hypothetical protein KC973_00160, partial [Candidatus Saccharibacteria bacterium]|nr:hypothetical protein [Candidatus Saccharibacteria bacterium]
EQIMSDTSLDNRKKLEKIKDLQWIKFTVLEILKRPNNTSMIEKEMETQKGNPGKLRAIEWGRFAARAALGNGQEAVSMLLGISEDRDEDFDTLMGEHLPDVVQGLTRIKDKRPKQATDRLLDGLGYLWSNAKQRYVKVFDKSETEVRPPSPV